MHRGSRSLDSLLFCAMKWLRSKIVPVSVNHATEIIVTVGISYCLTYLRNCLLAVLLISFFLHEFTPSRYPGAYLAYSTLTTVMSSRDKQLVPKHASASILRQFEVSVSGILSSPVSTPAESGPR